jgi:hypothetical protein
VVQFQIQEQNRIDYKLSGHSHIIAGYPDRKFFCWDHPSRDAHAPMQRFSYVHIYVYGICARVLPIKINFS